MIPKVVTLFLIAATAVSGQIYGLKSHPHQMVLMPALSRGCPTALEPAPLICKFMQPDLEFHYKPQLIAPSTYIPPLIVEKCDNPQMDIEIPVPFKPVVIPEPPVLPPITIPKFPVPVMVEKPMPLPLPVEEPCESSFIPEIPAKEIPLIPELPPISMPVLPEIIHPQPEPIFDVFVPEMPNQPIILPQPPVLSELVMPELPVRVNIPMAEPCLEDLPVPVSPIADYIPPAPMPVPIVEPAFIEEAPVSSIPEAPELPPLEMPALPEFVLPEPVVPQLAVEMPEPLVRVDLPIVEPCLEDQKVSVALTPYFPPPVPMPVPDAFQPAFVPEIHMTPELSPIKMPALPEIVVKPEPTTVIMSELPVRVETPMIAPCPEDQIPIVSIPEYIPPQFPKLPKPVVMPITLMDPCEPSSVPVKMVDQWPYYMRHQSYIPAIHGDYFNHWPIMRVNQPPMFEY